MAEFEIDDIDTAVVLAPAVVGSRVPQTTLRPSFSDSRGVRRMVWIVPLCAKFFWPVSAMVESTSKHIAPTRGATVLSVFWPSCVSQRCQIFFPGGIDGVALCYGGDNFPNPNGFNRQVVYRDGKCVCAQPGRPCTYRFERLEERFWPWCALILLSKR